MTWTKTSDDYEDDCWRLSDAAYRLHHEGLTWSNRKLLDCRIPKEDLSRFKRGDAIRELLDRGFWEEDGDEYVIVHHAAYQRTAEQVIRMQDSRRANGAKGGRPKGPAREIWQGKPSRKASSRATREPTGTGQDWPGQEEVQETYKACKECGVVDDSCHCFDDPPTRVPGQYARSVSEVARLGEPSNW